MSESTTTYWVRGRRVDDALRSAHRYASREEAERKEPATFLRTYEITVTDHGPAPEQEPTWWAVEFRPGEGWDVMELVLPGEVAIAEHSHGRWTFAAHVQARTEQEAKVKAIVAWSLAGFAHAPKAVDA